MNLFEIDSAVLDCVDCETGEIFDIEKFEELQMEREKKIENICLWIKNLNAEAEALKAEKDAFDKRKKAAENKAESLKKYISGYLAGASFESTKVKVSFRKSESVEVSDIYKIPEDYLKYKEPDVDKAALKKAIKEGKTIAGAEIVEKYNIQIK